MSEDWDEIRRLAADLQRAQLTGATQKLSERNCIELVSRLIKLQQLEVIYTADGKEYLTPQQLQREIKDEVYVAKGRVSLVDLATTLNVDFSQVEYQAQLISKGSGVSLVLGQLVDSSYLDAIAEEINERLQLEGTVGIGSLTKEYDLPSEFIQDEIIKRLGSIIEGFRDQHDPKTILTPTYVMRNKAKIRGALSAITVPTSVAGLVAKLGIQDQLFFSLAEELIQTKRLSGTLTGGKRSNKATYVPAVYARAQNKYVDDFFAQNGYVEYDALTRMGISDPKTFLKKRFPGTDVKFLSSCCVGPQVRDSMESSIEDAIASDTWIDIGPLLPSVLSPEDGKMLLKEIVDPKSRTNGQGIRILAETVLFTEGMLGKLEKSFDGMINQQAKDDITNKKYEKLFSQKADKFDVAEEFVDKKDERRKKAAAGKAGGGAQGRETKTKATKKHKRGKKGGDDDSDDDDFESSSRGGKKGGKESGGETKVEFMSRKALEEKLSSVASLDECPEDLYMELAVLLYPKLNEKFKTLILDLYQSSILASTHDKRKTHGELSEKTNTAIGMIRLFDKGLSFFEGSERQGLEKHLLRTLCTEMTNALFLFAQDEHGLESTSAANDFTVDQRMKVLTQVPKSVGEALHAIHRALAKDSVADFLECFETDCGKACDVFIKKADKKKDRQLVFNHRQSLLDQLEKCREPALALHLCVMVIFVVTKNAVLHASGKFVPQILTMLCKTGSLTDEAAEVLKAYQREVMMCFTCSEEDKGALNETLENGLEKVKEVAQNAKKNMKAAAE